MRPLPLFAPLLLATACSEHFTSTTGPTSDGTTSGPGDGGTELGADLPPVDEDLDEGGCEEFDGSPLPGAAVYFLGTYVETTDGWEGREEVRVFANQAWTSGADCSIVWITSASDADPGACGNCDLGLAVSADLDTTATTCSGDLEDLYVGQESFSVTYGIDLVEEATQSRWYFAESGTWFGDGYALGTASHPTALNFASDKTCWWL